MNLLDNNLWNNPGIILILIIVLLILVVFAIYGVSAYIRDRKQKTRSLKRRKINEEELLPNQEWNVFSYT